MSEDNLSYNPCLIDDVCDTSWDEPHRQGTANALLSEQSPSLIKRNDRLCCRSETKFHGLAITAASSSARFLTGISISKNRCDFQTNGLL